MVKINVRFPDPVHEAIKKLAEKHFRSLNGEIIAAIDFYVKHVGLAEATEQKLEEKEQEN